MGQTSINPVTGQVQIQVSPTAAVIASSLTGGLGSAAGVSPYGITGVGGGNYNSQIIGSFPNTAVGYSSIPENRSISIDGVSQVEADKDGQLKVRLNSLDIMAPFDCFSCTYFKKCDMKMLAKLKRVRDALSK